MQARVELLLGDAGGARRRDDRRLEVAVAVGVVDVAQTGGVVAAERGHRMPGPHQLLMDPAVGAAQHVPGVAGEQVGEAEPRPDLGARLTGKVAQRVVAAHEVDPHADRRGEPRRRLPGVLHVDADVAVAAGRGVLVERTDDVLAMERHRADGRIGRVDLATLLEDEAVVQIVDVLVVVEARQGQEAGLEVVRTAPALLEPGQVAAQHRDRRGVEVVAGVARRRRPLPAANEQARPLDDAAVDEGLAVVLDQRSGQLAVVAVERIAALGVVARREGGGHALAPHRGELGPVHRAAGGQHLDRHVVFRTDHLQQQPVGLEDARQVVVGADLCRQLRPRLEARRCVLLPSVPSGKNALWAATWVGLRPVPLSLSVNRRAAKNQIRSRRSGPPADASYWCTCRVAGVPVPTLFSFHDSGWYWAPPSRGTGCRRSC